jgi:hypothetical protein
MYTNTHTYRHTLYINVHMYTHTLSLSHTHTHKVLEAEENTDVQMRGDVYVQVSVSRSLYSILGLFYFYTRSLFC